MVKNTKIKGIGPHPHPVIHSLGKTLINNLMKAGFTDTQITLRTGHKSVQSVQPYANILGAARKRQQSALIIGDKEEEHSNSQRFRTSESLCDDDIDKFVMVLPTMVLLT